MWMVYFGAANYSLCWCYSYGEYSTLLFFVYKRSGQCRVSSRQVRKRKNSFFECLKRSGPVDFLLARFCHAMQGNFWTLTTPAGRRVGLSWYHTWFREKSLQQFFTSLVHFFARNAKGSLAYPGTVVAQQIGETLSPRFYELERLRRRRFAGFSVGVRLCGEGTHKLQFRAVPQSYYALYYYYYYCTCSLLG